MSIITTIIPTFNRKKELSCCIKSVLNQSFDEITLLVLDNASTDGTMELMNCLQEKDPRIKYIRHPKNIGAERNFLFGFNHVTTKYFSFLSDDDELFPDFYKTAIAELKIHPMSSFCALRTIVRSDRKNSYRNFKPGYYKSPRGIKLLARKFPPPTWTSIVYNTSIMHAVGGLDISLGFTADHDFTLRAAIDYPFIISGEYGSIFNYNTSSASKLANITSLSSDRARLISKLKAMEIRNKMVCKVSFYATVFYMKTMLMQSMNCFLNRDINSGLMLLKALARMLKKIS